MLIYRQSAHLKLRRSKSCKRFEFADKMRLIKVMVRMRDFSQGRHRTFT
jgi:hypothetical protein